MGPIPLGRFILCMGPKLGWPANKNGSHERRIQTWRVYIATVVILLNGTLFVSVEANPQYLEVVCGPWRLEARAGHLDARGERERKRRRQESMATRSFHSSNNTTCSTTSAAYWMNTFKDVMRQPYLVGHSHGWPWATIPRGHKRLWRE